jgi:YD repeat-containing protein
VATVTNFNVLGWKTSEQVGSLTATTYSYNPLGNATLVTDPALVKTHYDYNGFSQVKARIDFYQVTQAATTTFEHCRATPAPMSHLRIPGGVLQPSWEQCPGSGPAERGQRGTSSQGHDRNKCTLQAAGTGDPIPGLHFRFQP